MFPNTVSVFRFGFCLFCFLESRNIGSLLFLWGTLSRGLEWQFFKQITPQLQKTQSHLSTNEPLLFKWVESRSPMLWDPKQGVLRHPTCLYCFWAMAGGWGSHTFSSAREPTASTQEPTLAKSLPIQSESISPTELSDQIFPAGTIKQCGKPNRSKVKPENPNQINPESQYKDLTRRL